MRRRARSGPASARSSGGLRAVLGKSPLSFVQDLRVEQAIHRLHTTTQSIEEIANAVGYQDGVTLRTLLRKKTGRGIRELRLAGNPSVSARPEPETEPETEPGNRARDGTGKRTRTAAGWPVPARRRLNLPDPAGVSRRVPRAASNA